MRDALERRAFSRESGGSGIAEPGAERALLLKDSAVPLAPDGPRVKGVPSFSG